MNYRIVLGAILLYAMLSIPTANASEGVTVGPFTKNYNTCCNVEHEGNIDEEDIREPQKVDFPIQKLADLLYPQLMNRNTPFTVEITKDKIHSQQEIQDAFSQAMLLAYYRNEELRYDVRGYSYKFTYWDDRVIFTITPKYGQTKEQVEFVQKAVKEIVSQIITPNMNDHEKVKAIHDYIILNTEYDLTFNQAHNNPFYALTLKKTLCGGYSRLAALLLNEADVEARVISGYSSNSKNSPPVAHAWNLVKLDGKWYHLDITWDDPIPDKLGRIQYDYFLLPTEAIKNTHTWQTGGLNKLDQPYPPAYTYYEDEMHKQGNVEWLQSLQLLSYKLDEPEDMHSILNENYKNRTSDVSFLLPLDIERSEIEKEIKKFSRQINKSISYSLNNGGTRYPGYRSVTIHLFNQQVVQTVALQWAQPMNSIYLLDTSSPFNLIALMSDGSKRDVTLQSAFVLSNDPEIAYHLGKKIYFNKEGFMSVSAHYDGLSLTHSFQVVEPANIEEQPIHPEKPNGNIDEILGQFDPLLKMPQLKTNELTKDWTLYLNEQIKPLKPNTIQIIDEYKNEIPVTVSIKDKTKLVIKPEISYQTNRTYFILIHEVSSTTQKQIKNKYIPFDVYSS